jgi:hypothetical protein
MNTSEMLETSCEVPADLRQIPQDLKRMLKVQWKELIHSIEDYEFACGSKDTLLFTEPQRRSAA